VCQVYFVPRNLPLLSVSESGGSSIALCSSIYCRVKAV